MECKSIQSNSSSSTARIYDVFVSFRGEDTRNNFTDHLFGAFQRKGIVAFRDDRNLKQGEHISTELIQAIEGSRVLVVVFSKNYANSSWCLQELAKFVDCMNATGQSVLPVFYDVSPSEVRKQSGDYGKAFVEHEKRSKQDLGMVQRWREALEQVANLSGWDVQNKAQYGEIEKIVERVTCILGYKLSSLDGLVGIYSRVEQLEKLLAFESNDDVRVVGICGMGGIGKTTLARAAMDNLKAISLTMFPSLEVEQTTSSAEVLSRINQLRLLIIDIAFPSMLDGLCTNSSEALSYLSSELRFLHWDGYPFTYFPASCETSRLVVLHLPYSSIKQLWEGIKALYNLKIMNLEYSKSLVNIPDLSLAPNLEQLNLEGCTRLVHIHPSIGLLRKLAYLNLKNCTSLHSLPNTISGVSSLEIVNLQGCSKLFQSTSDAAIQCQSTFSVVKRLKLMLPLHFLNFRRHNDKVGSVTPSDLPHCNMLRKLDLSYCNLFNIPEAMTSLYCLEVLYLAGNNFVKLPCIIKELPRLISLNLDHCRQLEELASTDLSVPKELVYCKKKKARASLHIFNCPKLVGLDGWGSIAISWMIQFLKLLAFVFTAPQGNFFCHYCCYSWDPNSMLVQLSVCG